MCSTAPSRANCSVLPLVMYVAMHVRSCGLCVAISATTMVCSYFCTVATSTLLQLCCVWGYIRNDIHVSLSLSAHFVLGNSSDRTCFR